VWRKSSTSFGVVEARFRDVPSRKRLTSDERELSAEGSPAAVGRCVTLTLAISRHGHRVSLTRLRRVAAVGFVRDEAGTRRSLRRAVSLARPHSRR
jgi:hypothetical protein